MKILLGVNDKMKLYNVYRLCKQHIEFIKNFAVSQKNNGTYVINNWENFKQRCDVIIKIPVLKQYVEDCIEVIPAIAKYKSIPEIDNAIASQFNSKRNILYNKMNTIIELYESMGLAETKNPNAIDIKLPPCEDLDEYIKYLEKIEFIFTQCPFLQCDGEVLKFDSVDVGSNWLRLTIATASTCMLLNNTAHLVDNALTLRSHYISIQQQEEKLKSMQLKNEMAEELIKAFDLLRNAYMDDVIVQLEKDLDKSLDPEERDKTERSLEKLVLLLDKGGEIYPSLDAPDDIQLLFPKIESSLELPDNIVKYLEDKSEGQ